nr:solute carrier family 22 member 6-like [Penaeus vannamei]
MKASNFIICIHIIAISAFFTTQRSRPSAFPICLDTSLLADFSWLKWIFVMGGFFLIAGSLQVNYMYAPELFPTESRARGFAFVQLAGNVGAACAPLVTDVVSQYAWWAAGATFGCAGIVGSFLLPFLPETRNQPLPETLEDVQKRGRKNKKKREDAGHGAENAAYVAEGESSGKV